jgi:hypothetical protein
MQLIELRLASLGDVNGDNAGGFPPGATSVATGGSAMTTGILGPSVVLKAAKVCGEI